MAKTKTKMDRPLSAETRLIDLDTPVENILKWDAKGDRFQFDFERFLELDADTLGSLSKFNRDGYVIAKGVADKLKEREKEREEGLGPTEGLEFTERDELELNLLGGSASGRTRLSGGRAETHYCLKRVDEIEEAISAGYDFVDGEDPVKTPGMTKVGGTRRISRHGQDESVLMKIPKERYEKHIEAVSEIGRGQVEGARDDYHEAGREFKKKYHLEFSDNTKRVRANDRPARRRVADG